MNESEPSHNQTDTPNIDVVHLDRLEIEAKARIEADEPIGHAIDPTDPLLLRTAGEELVEPMETESPILPGDR